MVKLLSILSLVFALILFPPAVLAVISNNAVPGDTVYPIKRLLEGGVYAVASLNPTTKAWFAQARSDRRFQEVNVLITQGKQVSQSLTELVEQTDIAANQITQITDQKEKVKLLEQLSGSIEKYDKGLEQLSVSTTAAPTVQPTPTPTPMKSPTVTAAPSASPTVSPTVQPTVQPTPAPDINEEKGSQKKREIEEARHKLEEIQKRLQQQAINKQETDPAPDKESPSRSKVKNSR